MSEPTYPETRRGGRPARRLAAVAASVAVMLGGLAYLALAEPSYESRATLVLVPAERGSEGSELLTSLLQTGTVGTYQHYLGSSDEVRAAVPPGVGIAARAVPDTRVISVRTTGPRGEVQPALEEVVGLREDVDRALGSLWRLEVVESPQPAERAGWEPWMVLAGSGGAALLAAMAVLALGRRRDEPWAPTAAPSPNGAPGAADAGAAPGARVAP